MPGHWRAMTTGDIGAVSGIADVAHPDFPEDDAVFFERLKLAPQGCFILEREGAICGYLFSHPWLAGDIPPLNTPLKSLSEKVNTWYLHDLALLPQARGKGAAAPIIRHLVSVANEAHLPSLSLVAVNNSQTFWSRHGFIDASSEKQQQKLLSYDAAARYMVRVV